MAQADIRSQQPQKRICTEDVLVVMLDGLCVRCDKEHTTPCQMVGDHWRMSMRYQVIRGVSDPATIVKLVRRDRALKALGGR